MKALQYHPDVPQQLQALPPQVRRRVKPALEGLRGPEGVKDLDVKRLIGSFTQPLRRLKLGAWRVVFYQDGNTVYILRVFPRTEGYDWLDDWTGS